MTTTIGAYVSEIIDKTIARLNEKGWIQGDFQNSDGACCLVGAVGKAADTFEGHAKYEAEEHVFRRLRQVTGVGNASLTRWNDKPGRTKEEVIAALKQAKAA